jgi:hypothetical protein
MVEPRPWDQRLLERVQRGNDRVTGSPWVRLVTALLIVVVEVLNLADLSPPTAVFWSLTGVVVLVFVAPVVVRRHNRG